MMRKKNNSNLFLKQFLPFVVLILGGFYGLMEFRKFNYKFDNKKVIFREKLKEMGLSDNDYQAQTTVSLKDEYEKMMKEIDLDNWKNIRGKTIILKQIKQLIINKNFSF